ncbi:MULTISPECIES: hypothetical protein [Anaerolinea]|uniref:Uncharacterized protein n=1 Tax=Anaerolinea thermophila (strain DSM 14523 / JCM 11388 / NBRC 100420 / UNI-1) TaxID=926569 RepID=E8N130_ANATU|nr:MULTISPECIES: hypothetical protein [Anaerolinea]BAJ64773.1 hypothetical protein ANT_27470 [Anaerolinea thermophila UNI-1]
MFEAYYGKLPPVLKSVSLFLDDGSVFTGDLPLEPYAFDNPTALATWKMLRERGARRMDRFGILTGCHQGVCQSHKWGGVLGQASEESGISKPPHQRLTTPPDMGKCFALATT